MFNDAQGSISTMAVYKVLNGHAFFVNKILVVKFLENENTEKMSIFLISRYWIQLFPFLESIFKRQGIVSVRRESLTIMSDVTEIEPEDHSFNS